MALNRRALLLKGIPVNFVDALRGNDWTASNYFNSTFHCMQIHMRTKMLEWIVL